VLAYPILILLLRIAGKRTLSKMNAFDLIVTVALGSTLSSALISKDVTLADGTLALVLLIVLQFVVSWTSVRFEWVHQLVTGQPVLLWQGGQFLTTAMKRARVTESEILAAVRASGIASVDHVHAVILETDGSFSVVRTSPTNDDSALADVRRI